MTIQQQQLDALLAIQASLEAQAKENTAWIAEMRVRRQEDLDRIALEWQHVEARDTHLLASQEAFQADVLALLQARNAQEQAMHDHTVAKHQQWRDEDVARVEEQHRDALRYLSNNGIDRREIA